MIEYQLLLNQQDMVKDENNILNNSLDEINEQVNLEGLGDDNDFVINTSDVIIMIKKKRYVRKIEHDKLDSYFANPDFFTLDKCNSDYTSLKMATSPDDNSGITKLDGSPVPEEINNGVFLRGAFMCHNMTSAYNLNNSPRNYDRFYDSTKLGNLDGDILI